MTLENKLGITSSAELATQEERLSKKRALELFESGMLDKLEPGTFKTLQAIHCQRRLPLCSGHVSARCAEAD